MWKIDFRLSVLLFSVHGTLQRMLKSNFEFSRIIIILFIFPNIVQWALLVNNIYINIFVE